MKKVIISLAVILGVASAAYAFTPGEAPKEEPVALEHNHTHVHELNAEEGHQHDKESGHDILYYCLKCREEVWRRDTQSPPSPNNCPAANGGGHNWQIKDKRYY